VKWHIPLLRCVPFLLLCLFYRYVYHYYQRMSSEQVGRFQKMKQYVVQTARFAMKSSSFRALVVVLVGGAFGCSVVDQLVLDESSLFYGLSTAVVLLLKSVGFVAIAFTTNKFAAELESERTSSGSTAYQIFKYGSQFVVWSAFAVISMSAFVKSYQGHVFVDDSPYIFSYGFIALNIVLCTGQLLCLERILNIRRSKSVRVFRFVTMASFAIMLYFYWCGVFVIFLCNSQYQMDINIYP
jgi:hypothetical protein